MFIEGLSRSVFYKKSDEQGVVVANQEEVSKGLSKKKRKAKQEVIMRRAKRVTELNEKADEDLRNGLNKLYESEGMGPLY